MSGICGIVFHEGHHKVDPTHLALMTRAMGVIDSRKPLTVVGGVAGIGIHGSSANLPGVAEMQLGGQAVVLGFYGDLYNRRDISSSGTAGDVFKDILHLYAHGGMGFLERLRGEFALAIWDGLKETLFLASDRFRVNPLFYYQDQGKLVFGSKMRAIVECPLPLNLTINDEAVVDVVASSFVPTPKTIFNEVKKLPPGSVMSYRHGEVEIRPYWEISFLEPFGGGENDLAEDLKTLVKDAVSVRLEGEGDLDGIGAFLSGGIDSSTVTGVLTGLAGRPIKTFSIGFGEQQFNEIQYARITARAFGTEHHEYFVTPRDVLDAIPVLISSFDEPFANASAVPTYYCAKLAKDHGVHTLFAGDGGDELFAGNERYATQRLFDRYQQIPEWLRTSVVQPVVFSLAERLNREPFLKGRKYIQRANIPYPDRLSSYGLLKVHSTAELLEDRMLEAIGSEYDPYGAVRFHYFRARASSELDRQLYIDLKLAISDNDLFKVTRMTEAGGVRVQFPLLDHVLAEFAARVPSDIKMRGRRLRAFFKRAYSGFLPAEVLAKKKHGFGLPIPIWLRTDKKLNEMMVDLVLSPTSIQRGYFRKRTLEQFVEKHKADETSFYGTALWNLMVLELWHRSR